MEEWDTGLNQLTEPIKNTLLYVPKETVRAGKEMATGAPRKAFKTIMGISLSIVRLPLTLLMNLPLLPAPTKPDGSQDMMSLGEVRGKARNIASLSRQGRLFDSQSIQNVLNPENNDELASAA